tara:strand:+ start:62 stop:511 length:450 start_codon:yes stop_codon:yes gene_type:complete
MKKLKNNVKHFLYTLLALLLLTSCDSIRDKDLKSSKLELRQLVQETEIKKGSNGYFFLIGGGFNSYEKKITTVKVFAKLNDRFRIIEMPIQDIRISINNKLVKPNIQIEYVDSYKYSDEELVNQKWISKIYVVNCPEQYLPEKLLPIGL